MFGCLILFLCNTIKYLVEVKDLTLTMIVVLGLKCFMMEFTFSGCVCGVGVQVDIGRGMLAIQR